MTETVYEFNAGVDPDKNPENVSTDPCCSRETLKRRRNGHAPIAHVWSEVFVQFVKDRVRVSDKKPLRPTTLRSYQQAFSAFSPALSRAAHEGQLVEVVRDAIDQRLAAGKMTKGGINVYIRGLNSFFSWCEEFGFLTERIKIDLLPTERRKPFPRLRPEQVALYKAYEGASLSQLRAKHMALLILDTGLRAEECLALRLNDIDWKGSRIWVGRGKGGANREVPLSQEGKTLLRRFLAFSSKCRSENDSIVFCTEGGNPVNYRNALRDLKQVARRLGTPWVGWHSFRRTFATQYIRNGGLLTDLQQILGHADIRTTILYLSNDIEEIVALHDQNSPLAVARRQKRKTNTASARRAITTALTGGFRQRR